MSNSRSSWAARVGLGIAIAAICLLGSPAEAQRDAIEARPQADVGNGWLAPLGLVLATVVGLGLIARQEVLRCRSHEIARLLDDHSYQRAIEIVSERCNKSARDEDIALTRAIERSVILLTSQGIERKDADTNMSMLVAALAVPQGASRRAGQSGSPQTARVRGAAASA